MECSRLASTKYPVSTLSPVLLQWVYLWVFTPLWVESMRLSSVPDASNVIVSQDGQPFPERLLLELKHMIISHHGQYDYGSPKVPMTLEALALHYLDSLDSKIHTFSQLIAEDAAEGIGLKI